MTEQASGGAPSVTVAEQIGAAAGLRRAGRLNEAQAICEKLLGLDPNHAEALHQLGIIAYQRRQFGDAAALLDRAIASDPRNPAFYANRGMVLQELRQLAAAIADFDRAIALQPDLAGAYNNRGNARQGLKDFAAAVADYDKALALQPDFAEAYYNRGNARRALGKPDAAVADYDKAIALRPAYAEAYYQRGNARHDLRQLDAAIGDYDKAIGLRPEFPEALNNRGSTQLDLRRLDAAIADLDRATRLRPGYAEAHYNRGNAWREMGKLDAAIADYGRAIALKPDDAPAFNNRGVTLQELGQLDAALADFDKAIAVKPDHASAYWHKALILLQQGDLETGFNLFEWRWKNPILKMAPRSFAQPLWLGQAPLRDKTILLHGEQGLGDSIQFCRYAAMVARMGARVVLQVPRPLVALLQSLDGVSRVLADDESLPDFDYHCPLLSLPLAFATRLATIPDPTPYLAADPAKARAWRERLGVRKNLTVGLVWNGGFRPDQPEVWRVNERRNIRLDLFARALAAVDADFFSLQKGDPAEAELRGRELAYWPRGNFHNFAGDIGDFADTAALVANLDLVVTVDTATAHLAAALGTPTWILNRFDADWRWLLDRDDSPWYRSVKLYRQDDSRDWAPVLQRVAADLTQLAAQHRAASNKITR